MAKVKNLLNAVDLISKYKTLTRKIGDTYTCFSIKENKIVLLNQSITLEKITRQGFDSPKNLAYKGMSNPHLVFLILKVM
jgi:hypothetical protein